MSTQFVCQQWDDDTYWSTAKAGQLFVITQVNYNNRVVVLQPLSDFAGQATTVTGTSANDPNGISTFTPTGTVTAS